MSASPAAPSIPPASSSSRWLISLLLAAATLAFIPTLAGGFLREDFVSIDRFRELPWSAWPALFTHDGAGGVWYFITAFPLTGVIYFSSHHLYFPTVALALATGIVVASLALTHLPDTLGPVWLWAWSSPQCNGAPLLSPPIPTTRVIEHPVNSTRSHPCIADRHPVARLRAAPSPAVLYVSAGGHVTTRIATRPELTAAGLSNASREATVKSLALLPSP